MSKQRITVGHSPDPDDAFMFYALAHDKIDTGDLTFRHELQDIETLNRRALRGELEVTAISIHAYAYLLDKLRSMPEGDGTVLDNSMILFGAGLRDGDAHSPHNLPLVLGGRGGRRIASGQHLVYDKDSPLSNLYVSMLDAFGTPLERFADSTGPLPGVLTTA